VSLKVSQIGDLKVPFTLRRLFKLVPKTDLHVHIGGSTRKEDIQVFMKENGVSHDDIPKLMALIKPTYESITDILDAYYKVPKHVFTPSQFQRATFGIVQDEAEDNSKVLEVRTSILNKGGKPEEIVEAVEDGLREGVSWVKKNFGYNMRTYLTILAQRFGTSEESLETAKLAVELAKRPDSMIRGFDLAGDESKHSICHHGEALKYIKEHGPEHNIGLTLHAGETKSSENISGVESIRKAIEYGTDRLAHALRLLDDDELRKFVIENGIPIEMAPWSHVQIKAVDSYQKHPIRQFLEEGMKINLVTDNRLMSQITLRKQLGQLWAYELINTWELIKQTTINGIEAAFLSDEEKKNILAEAKEEFARLEKRFARTIEKYLSSALERKVA
jgi:adenosine deaminase